MKNKEEGKQKIKEFFFNFFKKEEKITTKTEEHIKEEAEIKDIEKQINELGNISESKKEEKKLSFFK